MYCPETMKNLVILSKSSCDPQIPSVDLMQIWVSFGPCGLQFWRHQCFVTLLLQDWKVYSDREGMAGSRVNIKKWRNLVYDTQREAYVRTKTPKRAVAISRGWETELLRPEKLWRMFSLPLLPCFLFQILEVKCLESISSGRQGVKKIFC